MRRRGFLKLLAGAPLVSLVDTDTQCRATDAYGRKPWWGNPYTKLSDPMVEALRNTQEWDDWRMLFEHMDYLEHELTAWVQQYSELLLEKDVPDFMKRWRKVQAELDGRIVAIQPMEGYDD